MFDVAVKAWTVLCILFCGLLWVLCGDIREALKSRHGEHRISAHNVEEQAAEQWVLGWWVHYVLGSEATTRCDIL